jgi:hypothetical protein
MDDIKSIVKEIKRVKSDSKQSNNYIQYSEYIAEQVDKTIKYSDYLSEQCYISTSYYEYK